MTFSVTVMPRDVVRATTSLALAHPLVRVALLSGPLLWALTRSSGPPIFGRASMPLLILSLVAAVMVWSAASYAAYRSGSADVYGPMSWTLDEEHIVIEREDGAVSLEWGDLVSWRHGGDAYLLHATRRDFLVVPGRALDPAQRAEFESFLVSRIGPRRR